MLSVTSAAGPCRAADLELLRRRQPLPWRWTGPRLPDHRAVGAWRTRSGTDRAAGSANEELQAAYRDLQTTQMQPSSARRWRRWGLRPASLTSSTAHRFRLSNVTTLEDSSSGSAACWRSTGIPAASGDPRSVQAEWGAAADTRSGIRLHVGVSARGGASAEDRARSARMFARSQDDVWQPVDLHEEIESSLTLLVTSSKTA